MRNNFKNLYKIKKLEKIKKNNKYIYIFDYNNISNKNIILIKKKIKKLKLNTLIIKKNLIHKKFLNIKLKGCLLIIYNNNYINLIKIIFFFKNLNFLIFLYKNIFYSKLKIKKILIKFNKNLLLNLINPYIFFIKLIKKI